MAYKTLLFGTDDLFETLKPFYLKAAEQGTLEIVAAAVFENGRFNLVTDKVDTGGNLDVDIAIISSNYNFYERMKQLEAMGIPRNRIIDGRVFKVPNLDFPRFLKERIAYGSCEINSFDYGEYSIYPHVIEVKNTEFSLKFGRQSFMGYPSSFEMGLFRDGSISVGNVSQYDWPKFFMKIPFAIYCSRGSQIKIGSDVWIGRRCKFKCTNFRKPLIIGDGAVIASGSVVVKSIPPYAIVGGNPAKIIKYRFEPHVIESLLRIKWWDWSLDKIHDNFKYFNDVEKFISLHYKEG